MPDTERIWTHTVDYRADRGHKGLINRGFWVEGLPRLIPLCRLFGHRPVVDGYDSKYGNDRTRWVACARCGVRPDPQGRLDPALWNIDDPFPGPFNGQPPAKLRREEIRETARTRRAPAASPPGPWPANPRGTLGGQLVVGGAHPGVAAEVKIGNMGSEHILEGHVHLGRLFWLSLHVEHFGRGIQRRLNPQGYESRCIGVSIHDGSLYWKLWGKRDSWSRSDPRWQQGSLTVDLRDIVLGPKRYAYENVDEPVTTTVRMPHGDDHTVTLQLQRQTFGRKHARKKLSWAVDWSCKGGIPTRNTDRGGIWGSGVKVSDQAAEAGSWPSQAAAAIAADMTDERVRRGFKVAADA